VSLVSKATKTLHSECGYKSGESVLVACSGGADSVALLRFLCAGREKLDISRLGVYHLNHGLRTGEARVDEEFVRKLAEKLKLTFHVESRDVAAFASEQGISLEMAGRKLRYEGLDRVCETESFDLAALGHTASDNVEWILLSLIRGRIEPLLWGIPARRSRYIRPLIRCSRDEVRDYLRELDQTCREDSSNTSSAFDRNRIRHRIIPLLKQENPSFEETIGRTLIIGDIEKHFQDSLAEQLIEKHVSETARGRELDTSKLLRYNPVTQLHAIRLFVPWLSAHEALNIIPLEAAKGTVEIGKGCGERLFKVYDKLVVESCGEFAVWEPVELRALRDEVELSGLRWRIKVYTGAPGNVIYENEDTVFFDAEKVKPPLYIRPWREGDRVVPYGRHNAVKVKRLFQDRKVPSRMRKYWPLVCKGEEILWVAGLLRSSAAPVTSETRKVTIMTLLRGDNGQ